MRHLAGEYPRVDNPHITAAAERQMHAWALQQEAENRASRAAPVAAGIAVLHSFVSISRQSGAGGSEIARLVGEKLGWEVLDKNVLDRIAERFQCSRAMLDLVDETGSNWLYDVLGTWMDRKIVPHEKYISYLGRVVVGAVRRGPCVLVGRGAQFFLPREKGLVVRLVAAEKYRLPRIVQQRGISPEEARQWMEQTDSGRRELVQRFFHYDINDPHVYDLVINVERFGVAGAVEQILAAVRQLGCAEQG